MNKTKIKSKFLAGILAAVMAFTFMPQAIFASARAEVKYVGFNETFKKWDFNKDGKKDSIRSYPVYGGGGMKAWKVDLGKKTVIKETSKKLGIKKLGGCVTYVIKLTDDNCCLATSFYSRKQDEYFSNLYKLKAKSLSSKIDLNKYAKNIGTDYRFNEVRAEDTSVIVVENVQNDMLGRVKYESEFKDKGGKLRLVSKEYIVLGYSMDKNSVSFDQSELALTKDITYYEDHNLKNEAGTLEAGTRFTLNMVYGGKNGTSFYFETEDGDGGWIKDEKGLVKT